MANYEKYTSVYSLADYSLSVTIPAVGDLPEETFKVGGPGDTGNGSCVGQIVVSRNQNLFETEGDVTGSWVHNKSLNRTGTITVDIRQVSNYIVRFILACNAFEKDQNRTGGMTITLTPAFNTEPNSQIMTATDCFFQKVPDQNFGPSAQMQSWVITCGRIDFTPTLI